MNASPSGNAVLLCATMFRCASGREWALTLVQSIWLNPRLCVRTALPIFSSSRDLKVADEQKDNQQTEKPTEPPKAAEPKAAVPKPPPPPPGAKPAAPAAPAKPKGPQQEPWSSPLVDAIKEQFGSEFVKSYSFIGQNNIEMKKDRIGEIMRFLRDNTIMPFS